MKTINWSGYEWITQERWGDIHPEKTYCWYDEHAVSIDVNSHLHLKTRYNPKWFKDKGLWSNTGVGLVSCTNKFKHGTFEIEAKLPNGLNLWPAFWMWSWDTWPPEIDVFEGYSDKNPNYLDLSNLLKIRKIESNVHYIGEDNKDKTLGAKKHWMGFKDPTKKFIKYKMTWLPESISIHYDNVLVRKIEDKNILKQLNATTLNVVINNHVTSKADSTYNWQNFQSLDQESDFTIKQFTYTKL
jgi:beta-glucanase (GH16 family)